MVASKQGAAIDLKALKIDLAALQTWYSQNKRDLPWRDYTGEKERILFRVWISEVMLQQTQVATVMGYFEKFITRFEDIQAVAKAEFDEVAKYFAGLGYYSRLRNFHKAAQMVAKDGFPSDVAGLLLLPGIGPYTAASVGAIALNQVTGLVDANVQRLFCRLGGYFYERGVISPKELRAFEKRSFELCSLAKGLGFEPRDFVQALMDYGATVCTPQNPDCGRCVLKKNCWAYKNSAQSQLPVKKTRANGLSTGFKNVQETCVALIDEDKIKKEIYVCLVKHEGQDRKWRKGLWDLPVLDGSLQTLTQWVEQSVRGLKKLKKEAPEVQTHHVVTCHKICRTTYVIRMPRNQKNLSLLVSNLNMTFKWVGLASLGENPLALGSAAKKTLFAIAKRGASAFFS